MKNALKSQFEEFIGRSDDTLPTEAHKEYVELARRYLAYYRPAGAEEVNLVQSLIHTHLHLRDLRRLRRELAQIGQRPSPGSRCQRYSLRYFHLRNRLERLQRARKSQRV